MRIQILAVLFGLALAPFSMCSESAAACLNSNFKKTRIAATAVIDRHFNVMKRYMYRGSVQKFMDCFSMLTPHQQKLFYEKDSRIFQYLCDLCFSYSVCSIETVRILQFFANNSLSDVIQSLLASQIDALKNDESDKRLDSAQRLVFSLDVVMAFKAVCSLTEKERYFAHFLLDKLAEDNSFPDKVSTPNKASTPTVSSPDDLDLFFESGVACFESSDETDEWQNAEWPHTF